MEIQLKTGDKIEVTNETYAIIDTIDYLSKVLITLNDTLEHLRSRL